jgi:predicted transporter
VGGIVFCPFDYRGVRLGIKKETLKKEKEVVYKSLILGILFSIGIFAVKGGIGLFYYLSKTASNRLRAATCLLYTLSYLLIFLTSGLILAEIDLIRHLEAIQSFLQSGMIIHLLMAGMLIVWGVLLLKRNAGCGCSSKGWLLLAVPCPVCAFVIFFSIGFLMTCFPDSSRAVIILLYMAFILLNLITVLAMGFWKRGRGTPPETLLGGAMLLIAVYFFLSVTVMPQFADMDKIYRMALYQPDTTVEKTQHLFLFLTWVAAAFFGGFGRMTFKIRGYHDKHRRTA